MSGDGLKNPSKRLLSLWMLLVCYGVPWVEIPDAKFKRIMGYTARRYFYGIVIGPFMFGFWSWPVKDKEEPAAVTAEREGE